MRVGSETEEDGVVAGTGAMLTTPFEPEAAIAVPFGEAAKTFETWTTRLPAGADGGAVTTTVASTPSGIAFRFVPATTHVLAVQ